MYNPTFSEQNRRRKLCHDQRLLYDDVTGECVVDLYGKRRAIGPSYISYDELRRKTRQLEILTVGELKKKAKERGKKGWIGRSLNISLYVLYLHAHILSKLNKFSCIN